MLNMLNQYYLKEHSTNFSSGYKHVKTIYFGAERVI